MTTFEYAGDHSVIVNLEYEGKPIYLRSEIEVLVHGTGDDISRIGVFNGTAFQSLENRGVLTYITEQSAGCSCNYACFESMFNKYGVRTHEHKNFKECIAASILCYCITRLGLTVLNVPYTLEIIDAAIMLMEVGYRPLINAVLAVTPRSDRADANRILSDIMPPAWRVFQDRPHHP